MTTKNRGSVCFVNADEEVWGRSDGAALCISIFREHVHQTAEGRIMVVCEEI